MSEGTERREEKEEDGTIIHEFFDRKVIRISENLVVKSGPNLRTHEAATLEFIRANTTIPVPGVHDVRWEGDRVTSIVMEWMPGERLDKVWGSIDTDQRLSIARELHGYISQIRVLKGTYIGGVDQGKALIGVRDAIQGGPFESEKEFNEFILADLMELPKLIRHYAKHALSEDHEILFTHPDIAPRKILVEGGRITAILDWEDAGWYPEYWEYTKALLQINSIRGWPAFLPHVFPPRYEKEYIGMSWLCLFLRH